MQNQSAIKNISTKNSVEIKQNSNPLMSVTYRTGSAQKPPALNIHIQKYVQIMGQGKHIGVLVENVSTDSKLGAYVRYFYL